MTREEAKALLPIIQAYIEGKTIQYRHSVNDVWGVVPNLKLDGYPENYRVKPEPKYRPFKSAEECWQEMQKHQPFGWVKDDDCLYNLIENISCDGVLIANVDRYEFDEAMGTVTFADGTPFGIKEEDKA